MRNNIAVQASQYKKIGKDYENSDKVRSQGQITEHISKDTTWTWMNKQKQHKIWKHQNGQHTATV
jgi:hypothetical protein